MKASGVMFIVGAVFVAMGMVLTLTTEDIELKGDTVLVVPEGADGYAYLEVDMGDGGPINGSFASTDGTSVRLSVMDEEQFDSFVAGSGDDSRTSVLGSSGDFSVEQVDMTVCYLVVRQFSDVGVEHSVEVEYTVVTTDWLPFLLSTGLWVGGGLLVWYPMYSSVKGGSGERTYVKEYTDVVFFDE